MTARETFRVGQHVQMTPWALALWPRTQPARQTGVVVGFSWRSPNVVAVVRDGCVSRQAYLPDYWEPIPEARR